MNPNRRSQYQVCLTLIQPCIHTPCMRTYCCVVASLVPASIQKTLDICNCRPALSKGAGLQIEGNSTHQRTRLYAVAVAATLVNLLHLALHMKFIRL
jgi:hypothetical protein